MEVRKDPLVKDNYYHIFSRSIAKYVIFNNTEDYSRFSEMLEVYQYEEFKHRYSCFKNLTLSNQNSILTSLKQEGPKYVDIVSYCLMPTHIHLALKQLSEGGITKYIAKILNSYSKYFNTKYHRKGPLWEGHFQNVLIKNDKQMLHLTRYIHLNPSSTGLVKSPFNWHFCSLNEYTNQNKSQNICKFKDIIDLNSKQYKIFILDRKDYQKDLAVIKNALIDNYSG